MGFGYDPNGGGTWSTGKAGSWLSGIVGAMAGLSSGLEGKERHKEQMELANNRGLIQQVIQELRNQGAIQLGNIRGQTAQNVAETNAGARTYAADASAGARMYGADASAGASRYRTDTQAKTAADKLNEQSGEFWGGTMPYDWSKIDLGNLMERGRNARNAATNATSRANATDRVRLGQRGQDIVDNNRKLGYAQNAYKQEMARRKLNDPLNFNEDDMPTFDEWVQDTQDPEVFPSLKDAMRAKPDIFSQQPSTVTPPGGPSAPPQPSVTPASGRVQTGSGPVATPAGGGRVSLSQLQDLADKWGLTIEQAKAKAAALGIAVQ